MQEEIFIIKCIGTIFMALRLNALNNVRYWRHFWFSVLQRLLEHFIEIYLLFLRCRDTIFTLIGSSFKGVLIVRLLDVGILVVSITIDGSQRWRWL